MAKKTYVVVGTGGRSTMYIEAILKTYPDSCRLAGFCDVNQGRMDFYNEELQSKYNVEPVATYFPDQFDRMIEEQKPDVVIVTSMDSTHDIYITRAMELGCDAITEKPMTVNAEKANLIFDTIEKTGRKLTVTFNYRYTPISTVVRDLVMKGIIGTPLAVDFSWVLNTSHGADYFRRWHREKDKSGGLLVHKATHHFDIINWWIEGKPETVFCMGDLKFYGRENAKTRGKTYEYDRYTGNVSEDDDPFALVLDGGDDPEKQKTMATAKALYLDAEKYDGYVRDRNVFGDNISIEDTMAVMVKYRNGIILNYSLLAYSPWEGWRAAITGTKGRIEIVERHGSHIILGQSQEEISAAQQEGLAHGIKVYPMFGVPYDVEIPTAEGGHGGADPIMLEQIFNPDPPADPYNRAASHIDGGASVLIGISANESIRTGLPVQCDDLLALP